jgi:MFS transporter, DHA3 family, macrolide efflux protein
MRIFKPLKKKQIALLFSGQVLSCIGDEIYSVALLWFAASLIGKNAGYIAAVQAGAILIFSVLGGMWSDEWNPKKVLIWADILRGLIVLIPVITFYFIPLSLPILIPMAILEASFTGVFNPTLRALVPEIIPERSLLNATNGLMEGSSRLARVIGPGLIALIGKWIPLVHFFTLDAFTFFGSAWSLMKLGPIPHKHETKPSTRHWQRLKEGLLGGAHLTFGHAPSRFAVLTSFLSGPPWYLIMPLAMTLLIHNKMPENYGALGLFIAVYGIGNLAGNMIGGSLEMKRPERFLSWGRCLGGAGFMVMGLASKWPWLLISAMIAASGGPVTELGFLAIIQNRFQGIQATRVFRFNLAFSYLGILLIFLCSPYLFKTWGVERTIFWGGVSISLSGVLGFVLFPKTF